VPIESSYVAPPIFLRALNLRQPEKPQHPVQTAGHGRVSSFRTVYLSLV
jgi:hypothetical protein